MQRNIRDCNEGDLDAIWQMSYAGNYWQHLSLCDPSVGLDICKNRFMIYLKGIKDSGLPIKVAMEPELQGLVIGYAHVGHPILDPSKPGALVRRLESHVFVCEPFRVWGYGKALVHQVLAALKQDPLNQTVFAGIVYDPSMRKQLFAPHRLYRSLGFVDVKRVKGTALSSGLNSVDNTSVVDFMTLRLKNWRPKGQGGWERVYDWDRQKRGYVANPPGQTQKAARRRRPKSRL